MFLTEACIHILLSIGFSGVVRSRHRIARDFVHRHVVKFFLLYRRHCATLLLAETWHFDVGQHTGHAFHHLLLPLLPDQSVAALCIPSSCLLAGLVLETFGMLLSIGKVVLVLLVVRHDSRGL